MCYKKGFSLLSFLLYIMLFSTVTFFVCHIITIIIIPSLSYLRKNQSIIALHIASDFFVRDIRTMREGKYIWKVILPHEIIWQKDDGCNIGWSFSRNSLERKEGIYNGGWREAKTSTIAKGLMSVIFTAEKDKDDIIGVELVLLSECAPQKPVLCYVSLKGGKHEKLQ